MAKKHHVGTITFKVPTPTPITKVPTPTPTTKVPTPSQSIIFVVSTIITVIIIFTTWILNPTIDVGLIVGMGYSGYKVLNLLKTISLKKNYFTQTMKVLGKKNVVKHHHKIDWKRTTYALQILGIFSVVAPIFVAHSFYDTNFKSWITAMSNTYGKRGNFTSIFNEVSQSLRWSKNSTGYNRSLWNDTVNYLRHFLLLSPRN